MDKPRAISRPISSPLGGDLRYHINKKIKFSEDSVLLFIAEIALALNYLRKNNIIHRDIKPDNILLDEEGETAIFTVTTNVVQWNAQITSST